MNGGVYESGTDKFEKARTMFLENKGVTSNKSYSI